MTLFMRYDMGDREALEVGEGGEGGRNRRFNFISFFLHRRRWATPPTPTTPSPSWLPARQQHPLGHLPPPCSINLAEGFFTFLLLGRWRKEIVSSTGAGEEPTFTSFPYTTTHHLPTHTHSKKIFLGLKDKLTISVTLSL